MDIAKKHLKGHYFVLLVPINSFWIHRDEMLFHTTILLSTQKCDQFQSLLKLKCCRKSQHYY